MSIADKLTTIAENQEKVYEAGNEDMLRAMWEAIQSGGKRSNYNTLLNYTSYTKKTFKPIYDIKITGTYGYNWSQNTYPNGYDSLIAEGQVNMKELEEEQGMKFDFSESTNLQRGFASALFSELNVIDVSKLTSADYAFYGGYIPVSLRKTLCPKRIERLICTETTKFVATAFQYAVGFEYIGFEGVIAQNGLDLQWSTELNKESITALVNTLSPDTSGLSVTISQTAKQNAFTDEEWASLIATKSNWTISLA